MEKYRTVRRIGAGSFGEVFLVEGNRDGQQHVMKVSRAATTAEANVALQEVLALSRCQHRCIVELLEVFLADGQHSTTHVCYVMDYYPEGDLAHWINDLEGNPPPEYHARAIARDVADALQYLHQRKLIHRDVKPSNVLLADGAHRAVLADFGLVRSLGTAGATTQAGTQTHMAPEQARGAYNESADVWALGCVLFELLSGKLLLHHGVTLYMERLMRDDFDAYVRDTITQQGRREWSAELVGLVLGALAREPTRRPAAVEMMFTLAGEDSLPQSHTLAAPQRSGRTTPVAAASFPASQPHIQLQPASVQSVPAANANGTDQRVPFRGVVPGTEFLPTDSPLFNPTEVAPRPKPRPVVLPVPAPVAPAVANPDAVPPRRPQQVPPQQPVPQGRPPAAVPAQPQPVVQRVHQAVPKRQEPPKQQPVQPVYTIVNLGAAVEKPKPAECRVINNRNVPVREQNEAGRWATLSFDGAHTKQFQFYCAVQCGRTYLSGCPHCDGHCGPDDGCQCAPCRKLSQKYGLPTYTASSNAAVLVPHGFAYNSPIYVQETTPNFPGYQAPLWY
eukprot:TRINITY_DN2389_c0_g1_i1.p1 TRINITY_DN2389_c0_g1~~TRINITY_DN2389_c0_g1_i1.p1  ORF type:complete len:562 (+),score=71.17 TRINITY_DN2389_c0_g1_i1:128-1813(+)